MPSKKEIAQFHKEIECYEAIKHIEDCKRCQIEIIEKTLEDYEFSRSADIDSELIKET